MRLLILTTGVLASGVALGLAGWLVPLLEDQTRLSLVILALGGAGVVCVAFNRRVWAERLATLTVWLGLIGTLIGFVIATTGVDATAAADVSRVPAMVGALLTGLGVALGTTLTGAVCHVWIKLSLWIHDER